MALSGAVLATLLQSCAPNVAPSTMVAIIQVESEGDPFRIGVNSGASLQRQPANAAEAIATARGLIARGANFDAGLMQINSSNFGRLGLTPENLFDPCTNIRAGARVLADNYQRARDAGHNAPLQAAISEYNTGSRERGFRNGYVGRVYSAAGQPYRPAATPAVAMVSSGGALTPNRVGQMLLAAFGGRVTDTWRPMNASYGAENSFHKYGQAVDFVPRGGMSAISRAQIRAVMAANGIQLLELLGPGDAGHSDHWHVAFATGVTSPSLSPAPTFEAPQPWSVAVASPASGASEPYQAVAQLVDASLNGEAVAPQAVMASASPPPPPPAWDVFATAAWQRQHSGAN
jgi:hypothetical protein